MDGEKNTSGGEKCDISGEIWGWLGDGFFSRINDLGLKVAQIPGFSVLPVPLWREKKP